MECLLTVRWRFQAVDDLAAREMATGIYAAVKGVPAATPREGGAGEAKLQELRHGVPPRKIEI